MWTEVEKEILKENYGKVQKDEMQKLLPNRTWRAIMFMASKFGYSKYEGYQNQNKKYGVNQKYFSVCKKDNSYWAGFLGADGTIYKKSSVVALKLQARDVLQLEEFVKEVEFTGNIRTYLRDTNKGNGFLTSSINICGVKQWVDDLERNYNITPNKSIVLKAPSNLNIDNSLAYIKGYLDGNGSIFKNKSFQILTTESLSQWMKAILESIHSSNIIINPYKKTNGLYTVSKAGIDSEKILNILNNSTQFGLQRKWCKLL